MNEAKRQVPTDKGLPGEPEKISALIKPGIAGEKPDKGKKNTETDRDIDELEDRLNNLFMESEGVSVPEDSGPKPTAVLADRKKRIDPKQITDAFKSKTGDDVPAKPQPPAPNTTAQRVITDPALEERFKPVDLRAIQKRLFRDKFFWSGISAVLAGVVLLIIFMPSNRVKEDAQQKPVIVRKIDPPPLKIQPITETPAAATQIDKKFGPGAHLETVAPLPMPEAGEAIHPVEKEADGFNAPAVSYPYSIHAGSFRSLQSAERSVDDFRKTGLQAFWTRIDLGEKGVWYRVLIGCYPDSAAAQGIIRKKQLKDARYIRVNHANFLGAFLSEDALTKQSRFLRERGYSSYVIQDDAGKNYLYAGAFDTWKEAEEFSVELSSRGIRSLAVER